MRRIGSRWYLKPGLETEEVASRGRFGRLETRRVTMKDPIPAVASNRVSHRKEPGWADDSQSAPTS